VVSCQLSGQQYREAVTQTQPRVAALRGYPGKPFACAPSTPTGVRLVARIISGNARISHNTNKVSSP